MQNQLTLWAAEKRCRRCGEDLPLDAFPPSGYTSGTARCWECQRADRRRYVKKYYDANAEMVRAKVYAWREANAEAVREYHRQYYEANKEAAAATNREYKAANRRRCTDRQQTRKALQLAQFVEHVDALVVLERDDGCCGICGGDVDPLDFHVDHIVPLALGGKHSYANTQPAHPRCNVRKGARHKILT